MSMFINLSDLADLSGSKSRALLAQTMANAEEAVKKSVASGDKEFLKQVLADFAKQSHLARVTPATKAEVKQFFSNAATQAFADELFEKVKNGASPINPAGNFSPPMPQPLPWQSFTVLDPNTPSQSVPGETYVAVVSSPTQSAPTPAQPLPPAYVPPPSYAPPPVVAPQPSYAPPVYYAPPPQQYYPPTPLPATPSPSVAASPSAAPAATGLVPGISNGILVATGLGGLLLLGAIVMTRGSRSRDRDRDDRRDRDRDMRQNKKRRRSA